MKVRSLITAIAAFSLTSSQSAFAEITIDQWIEDVEELKEDYLSVKEDVRNVAREYHNLMLEKNLYTLDLCTESERKTYKRRLIQVAADYWRNDYYPDVFKDNISAGASTTIDSYYHRCTRGIGPIKFQKKSCEKSFGRNMSGCLRQLG
ncbi:hypothetical protein [Pseudobacteriovorax antillogorgiicola]|uniref:Lysozyme inhibitor LprI N-terminal domain-containing protein n=1 Tax=Pseudobacteriovorax antillogorgiicola TaxID=1513793 RepID=A0A1Y6CVF9_9BACT|nr:hypothetical protein [Pseudobacteriovorax antillogorgiicola]TCS44772.1 hypothetical protein EDD56_1311 [Pseudobacteriovorax antillogorgiicola]SMF77587.1 hypothetical protein SAMN06296036_13163 [Pseudobacteriovorax antillogorgiicola]